MKFTLHLYSGETRPLEASSYQEARGKANADAAGLWRYIQQDDEPKPKPLERLEMEWEMKHESCDCASCLPWTY